MLSATVPNLGLDDGIVEGHFHYPQAWKASTHAPTGRNVYLLMGDPLSGPILWLASLGPTTDGWTGSVRTPAHSHRTDSFRLALGTDPEQFKSNSVWIGEGEYALVGANEVYVETGGTRGCSCLLVFADRRGINHGYEQGVDGEALNARWTEEQATRMLGEGNFFPIHLEEDDAIKGLRTTFADLGEKRARLFSSVEDRSGWTSFRDGSEAGALFMADEEHGPVIVMTHNVPGSVEAPVGSWGTDVFRLVLSGRVKVGDREYGPREFRAVPAEVSEGPVVHGPEGSTQLLLLADRSGGFSAEAGNDAGRIGEMLHVFGLAGKPLAVG